MSESKSLAVVDRDEIISYGKQLQTMYLVPGGGNLTPEQSWVLARVAIQYGLDPLTGEIYFLPKFNTIGIGIKGLRRSANRVAKNNNLTWWISDIRKVPPETHGEPEDSVIYEVDVSDTEKLTAWTRSRIAMRESGMEDKTINELFGKPPVVTGVGIFRPKELEDLKDFMRWRINGDWKARKRAEADALRQRFDLQLPYDDTYDIDPAIDVDQIDDVAVPEPEPRTEKENLAELGYELPKEQKVYKHKPEPGDPKPMFPDASDARVIDGNVPAEKIAEVVVPKERVSKGGISVIDPSDTQYVTWSIQNNIVPTATEAKVMVESLRKAEPGLPDGVPMDEFIAIGKVFQAWLNEGKGYKDAAQLTINGEKPE